VTRIGPIQNQLELARILDRTGLYGDETEGTYRHGKPTEMMARDRAPKPRRFEQLLESLQDGELFSTFCHGLLVDVYVPRKRPTTKKYGRRGVACCIAKTTAHSMAWLSSRNRFSRTGGYRPNLQIESRPGALCSVLVLQKKLVPPRPPGHVPGELCGRGWSQLGGGHGALGGCPLARVGVLGGAAAPPLAASPLAAGALGINP
jgi:hypothetical protein